MSNGHDFATTGRAPTDPRPAPDDLEILRAFVNTDSRFYGFDGLLPPHYRPEHAARMLPGFDVGSLDERARRRLSDLRGAVRALIAGEPAAAEAVTRIAARVPLRLTLQPSGSTVRARLTSPREDVEAALTAAVLTALQVALVDGRIERLQLCQRPECGWCYYDSTKNRSGRWCSSDPCGDVMKVRAFRARQAAGS